MSEDTVVYFENYLPHVRISVIEEDKHTEHVIPLAFFEDVASGRRRILEMDGWEGVVKSIIRDWIEDTLAKIEELEADDD